MAEGSRADLHLHLHQVAHTHASVSGLVLTATMDPRLGVALVSPRELPLDGPAVSSHSPADLVFTLAPSLPQGLLLCLAAGHLAAQTAFPSLIDRPPC